MVQFLSNISIRKQLVLLSLSVGTLIALSIFSYSVVSITKHEKERFISESMMEARLLSDFIISPLAFYDKEGVEENLRILSSHKSVKQAIVFDSEMNLFASYNPNGLRVPKVSERINGFEERNGLFEYGTYHIYRPIVFKEERLGYLYVEKESSAILNYSFDALLAFGIFSLIAIALVTLLAVKKSQIILEPIIMLAESMQSVAKKKNYQIRVNYPGNNEIARLYVAMNALLQETETLTSDLESRVRSRTQELQNSLENLTLTQNQLIEAEKMAALGNLVSGVAHEVNTPLGNALTGGSIILREVSLIQSSLEEGSLKRSTMDEKLSIIHQSASLLIKSLTQAAELVKSFKRISVDQSTDDLRDFDLRAYLQEILQTYHNKLKHKNVSVEIQGADQINILSYPGTYAQIFNNLLNNALLHAFDEPKQDALIIIALEAMPDHITIRFSDNGSGVDEKIKSIIFEPFVTTKRNSGGTGLGMNILYNLVTQKLGGTIQFDSQIGFGTTFELKLPYITRQF